ncbi:MAG: TlpA family protein disulfide reductase [Planctomycetes bacterium]|nr:TlpA family protein disulfide reductase [Planctomycetota bacterium]
MRSSIVWFGLIAVIPGCAPESGNTSEGMPALSPIAPTTEHDVSLRVTDADGLQEVLEKHRGKVVLVDFWATWCGPCVEQFPHTVEIANRLRDRGLAVVSVSMDNPSAEPQVQAFLEKQNARFDNLLRSYSSPVTATKAFGLPGPVPCYRVYDRKGELHREFGVDPRAAKQFTTADIEGAVEEIL